MKQVWNNLEPTEEEIKLARLRFLLRAKMEMLKKQKGTEYEPEKEDVIVTELNCNTEEFAVKDEKKLTQKEQKQERKKKKELEKHFQTLDEKIREAQRKRNKKSHP